MNRRRKSTRSANDQTLAHCEVLEDRSLLTATLEEGVLEIVGTDENDRIRVRADGENLVVNDNGEITEFALDEVAQIDIAGLAGNDRIGVHRNVEIPVAADGGEGNDIIIGGAVDDDLSGGTGRDLIYGRGGNNTINGGDDNDRLFGGNDNDTIDGGLGNDGIVGGAGDDSLGGGEGNDRIRAGRGNDFADGGAGDDRIDGGAGDDTVIGGEGNDTLRAGDGSDDIQGGADADVLFGNSNFDLLDAGDDEGDVVNDSAVLLANLATEIHSYLDDDGDGEVTQDEAGRIWWRLIRGYDTDTAEGEDPSISVDEMTTGLEAAVEDFGRRGSRFVRRITRFFERFQERQAD